MLRLANVFGAHMVLQRDKEIAVFGEADGEVRVTLGESSACAKPRNGRFIAKLPPMKAGGPYTMTVTCGGETAAIEDVMIGEVWLCGGQSNMEFRLRDDQDFAEADELSDPRVRFYEQPQAATPEQAEKMEKNAHWIVLEPGKCGSVSAVAFYAAMDMAKRLDVPVGMVICCIGGSSASAWIGRDELETFPQGAAYIEEFKANVGGKSDEQFDRENAAYMRSVEEYCRAQDALKREQPGISVEEASREIGDFPWPPPVGRLMLRRPGGPYETMLSRLAPLALRGFLYYQGEEDAPIRRAKGYDALFGHLIAAWRALFEDEGLTFVAAQLPGYGADPACDDWPEIRAAQQRAIDAAGNAALACLIDCGEQGNIHPIDKKTPGRRMGALALQYAYGLDERADAPRMRQARLEGERLVLTCEHAGGAMAMRGDAQGALDVSGADAGEMCVRGKEIVIVLHNRKEKARVRYAWENWPKAVFFGENGLPLFPFEIEI